MFNTIVWRTTVGLGSSRVNRRLGTMVEFRFLADLQGVERQKKNDCFVS